MEFGADGGSLAIAIIVEGCAVDCDVSAAASSSSDDSAAADLIANVRALKWFRYECEWTVFASAAVAASAAAASAGDAFDRRWSDVSTAVITVVICESVS